MFVIMVSKRALKFVLCKQKL